MEEQELEEKTENSTIASPSKSLSNLIGDGEDIDNSSGYAEIYQALGLSGEDDERINLTKFRRIISENLDIDSSFMYKRVFNAFDRQRNDYLTAKELVSSISILLQGPFEAQVELGMRVYGKPITPGPENQQTEQCSELSSNSFTITQKDAIQAIVESLQLSSPRSRHTLATNNREKAQMIGEDLVMIIYPKLDIDGDGVITLDDFSKACHQDPSLIQVFGQYLPKNTDVLPTCSGASPLAPTSQNNSSLEPMHTTRPRSSPILPCFAGIDYMHYSPTIGIMWGRPTFTPRKSERLEPIPMVKPRQ